MNFYFKADSWCEVTREAREGDDYDRGNTLTTWSIGDTISLEYREGHWNAGTASIEIKEGVDYFLLYAIYSTGDSFGHDERNRMELVDLFTDRETAKAAAKSLNDENFYINQNGETVDYYRPWCGYFESLDELEVVEVKLV